MDEQLRRKLRDEDPRAALDVRRVHGARAALDAIAEACVARDPRALEVFAQLVATVSPEERLAVASSLDRLAHSGVDEAAKLWREWFPAASWFIGGSSAIQRVRAFAYEHARRDEPICIVGESGVGKRLLARVIHELSGRESFATTQWAPIREAATLFIAGLGRDDEESEASSIAASHSSRARLIVSSDEAPSRWSRQPDEYRVVLVPTLDERRADIPALVDEAVARRDHPKASIHPAVLTELVSMRYRSNVISLISVVAELSAVRTEFQPRVFALWRPRFER